jgi:hypothetical protein
MADFGRGIKAGIVAGIIYGIIAAILGIIVLAIYWETVMGYLTGFVGVDMMAVIAWMLPIMISYESYSHVSYRLDHTFSRSWVLHKLLLHGIFRI